MVIGGGTKQHTPKTAGKEYLRKQSKKRSNSSAIKKRIPSSLTSAIVKEGDYVIKSSVLNLFKVKLDDPNISLSQIQISNENEDQPSSFNLNKNTDSINSNCKTENIIDRKNTRKKRIGNLKRGKSCLNKENQLNNKTDNDQHPLRRNVISTRARRRKKISKGNLNKSKKNIVRISLPKTRVASMNGKRAKSFSARLSAKNQINKVQQKDSSVLKQKQANSSPMVGQVPVKQSSRPKERSNSRKVASFDDKDYKFSYQDKTSRKLLQTLCAPKKGTKSKRVKKKETSQKAMNLNASKQQQNSKTQIPPQPSRQQSIVPNEGKELMLDMIASDVPTVLIAPGDYQHIYKFMNKDINEKNGTMAKSDNQTMKLAMANVDKKQQRKVYRIPSDAPTVLVEVMEKAKKITENDINDWKLSHFLRNQKEMSSKNTSAAGQSEKSSDLIQSLDPSQSKEMNEKLSQEISKNMQIESIKSPFDPVGCLKKPIFPTATSSLANDNKFSIFGKCCESCSIF